MQKDLPFIQRTIELAKNNIRKGHGGPFGALIVKDNKVVAEGVNTVTTHFDPTAHAEINAIRAACVHLKIFSLEGFILYSSCEPCPMCLAAAYWARIDKIIFASGRGDAAEAGFDDEYLYAEMNKEINRREIPMEFVPVPEAKEVFQQWENSPFKQRY